MLFYYSTTYWVLFYLCGHIFGRFPPRNVRWGSFGVFVVCVIRCAFGRLRDILLIACVPAAVVPALASDNGCPF